MTSLQAELFSWLQTIPQIIWVLWLQKFLEANYLFHSFVTVIINTVTLFHSLSAGRLFMLHNITSGKAYTDNACMLAATC